MERKLEIVSVSYAIIFYFHLCKAVSETLVLIRQVYKDRAHSRDQFFRKCDEFKNGWKVVEDMERSALSFLTIVGWCKMKFYPRDVASTPFSTKRLHRAVKGKKPKIADW